MKWKGNKAEKLTLIDFGSDPLCKLNSRQAKYIRSYLSYLDATIVLIESNYFDRDYLSEFSAFYSISSTGYPNICKRLHFFSRNIKRNQLFKAAGGSKIVIKSLQDNYLGFIIIRPISSAPLGRTVLKWYEDKTKNTPRVTKPSRRYECNVAGFKLYVEGIAWQQQDKGVGACATVCLWSLFHSSAFDDNHAIPTTAEITMSAHKSTSLGQRVFPATGLKIEQMTGAIKEQSLAPVVLQGKDIIYKYEKLLNTFGKKFGKERFSSTCASFIISGYPVVIIGLLDKGNDSEFHAICMTGFRSADHHSIKPNEISLQDSNINYLYIHDDNLGPNIRFKICEDSKEKFVYLQSSPPPDRHGKQRTVSPTLKYPRFIPTQLVVAVHNDLRTSPDTLHKEGLKKAELICQSYNILLSHLSQPNEGMVLSTRFMKVSEYLNNEIPRTLKGSNNQISKTILALCEKAPPMSLHIGVIRIALDDSTPFIDIIYDTTDTDISHPVFANIAYNPIATFLYENLISVGATKFGVHIKAY